MPTNLFSITTLCLNIAAILYLIITLAYILNLILKNDKIFSVAIIATIIAFIFHTAGLIIRWHLGGWLHPPLTNMYESLIFFVWGIILVFIIVELKYRIKFIGVFVVPVALIGMGLAALNSNKEIEPLIPALQSIWLHIHVATATIGYGAFVVGAALATLFLIKDRVKLETFYLICLVFSIFVFVVIAIKSPLLTQASYTMNGLAKMGDKFFNIPGPETTGKNFVPLRVQVPFVGFFMIVSWLLSIVAFLSLLWGSVKKSEKINKFGRKIFYLFYISYVHAIAALIISILFFKGAQVGQHLAQVKFSSNPYEFALLVVNFIILTIFFILGFIYDGFANILPTAESLDNLSYKSILLGFPFMTLLIITGAVWAHYAWGRYWGWDPKETWSLITWFIYAIYLHGRYQRGWRGRPTAVLAIIGIVAVIFTYLGVNLLLSGLHSYGG